MKKMKEIRDLSLQEKQALVEDLGREIFMLRNELKMNRKLDKPHFLKEKKKTRARVLTALSEVKG